MTDLVSAADLEQWVRAFAQVVTENKNHLTELDSAIGDGDHGANMDRGMQAVLAALDTKLPDTPATLFSTVGMTLVSTVGGASGPLFGTLFLRLGSALGTTSEVSLADLARALRAGLDGIVARGKAEAGDKTLYDALAPAVEALEAAAEAGTDFGAALQAAAEAAATGRDATIPMSARKGRASYLGERSVGHQDPGATTVALLLASAVGLSGS